MQKSNYLIVLALVLAIGFSFIFPMVSAESDSLGTFKAGEDVLVSQACASCSYMQIAKVQSPSQEYVINENMTKNGYTYTYNFNNTQELGLYQVTTCGDPLGLPYCVVYDFEVTPSGYTETLGFYFILIGIVSLVILLGFLIKEAWFVVIGGLVLMIVGLYSLNNGIAGFKDMFLTWAISLFEIGVGFVLSVGAAFEKIQEE